MEAVPEEEVAMEIMEVDEEITFNLSRGDGLAGEEEEEDTQEFEVTKPPSPPKPPSPTKPPSPVRQLSPGLYPALPRAAPAEPSPIRAPLYPDLSPTYREPGGGEETVPSEPVSAWAPWGGTLSRAPLQRGSAPLPTTSVVSEVVEEETMMETSSAAGTLEYPSPPKPVRLLLSSTTMTPPDTPESTARMPAQPATVDVTPQPAPVSPVKAEQTEADVGEISVTAESTVVKEVKFSAEEGPELSLQAQEPATQLPTAAVVMEEDPGLVERQATTIEAAIPLVEPSAVVMEEAPGLVETHSTAMEADSSLDEPPKPVSPQVKPSSPSTSEVKNIEMSVEEDAEPSRLAEIITKPPVIVEARSKETVSTVVDKEPTMAEPSISVSEVTQSPRKPSPEREAAPLAEPASPVADTPMRGQVSGVEQFKRSLRTRSRSPLKAARRTSAEGDQEREDRAERL
ncbi:proteoglycan 4-like [Branchiostoma floridae]|uniref:Proteoglycan 4-like n=1 Tax=Branchiostoma floridae TaxID=7739 RepID=A0A9J7MAJ9_BRAFL|nr:proteoglycan 4-like [Branchiostoma floridae]